MLNLTGNITTSLQMGRVFGVTMKDVPIIIGSGL